MDQHPIHKQYIIAIAMIIILAIGIILFSQKRTNRPNSYLPENDEELIFCTADAMQCPDGSYVGRTGPNCEFECPNVSGLNEFESETETKIELVQ